MIDTKDVNQPNYESPTYQAMMKDVARAMDVYSGARALRESPTKYLNQFSRESADNYTARKDATEFFNVFAGTISSAVGMIVGNNIAPAEAPEVLATLFTDVDLCGNDLQSFLRETERNAMRDGHSFIFVDAPPSVETDKPATKADVAGRRPYWINYTKAQAINWSFDEIDGQTVLAHITFKEVTKEKDGEYGEKCVTRYRVIKRGSYSLYRFGETDNKRDIVLEIADQLTAEGNIRLAVVYGSRKTGIMESQPPFLDLLQCNLSHYNAQSVLNEALKYVVPMPVFHVNEEGDAEKFQKLVAAANRSVIIWGEHSGASYLELKGDSVPALERRISELEMRMAKLGLEKFAPIGSDGAKTATEVGSDNRKETSELSVMARNLESAAEQAFYFTAELMNSIHGPNTVNLTEAEKSKLKLNIDYDKLTFSLQQVQFLAGEVEAGRVSMETYLEMLPSAVEMPKGFNAEQERERLSAEGKGASSLSDLEKRIDIANKADGLLPLEDRIKIIQGREADLSGDAAAMALQVAAEVGIQVM